jgi:hypothetical protein
VGVQVGTQLDRQLARITSVTDLAGRHPDQLSFPEFIQAAIVRDELQVFRKQRFPGAARESAQLLHAHGVALQQRLRRHTGMQQRNEQAVGHALPKRFSDCHRRSFSSL